MCSDAVIEQESQKVAFVSKSNHFEVGSMIHDTAASLELLISIFCHPWLAWIASLTNCSTVVGSGHPQRLHWLRHRQPPRSARGDGGQKKM